ncbi:MAG: alpha/beta hydrolase [bacterium]|nr:alpha/beta hydrolase [bacterium]
MKLSLILVVLSLALLGLFFHFTQEEPCHGYLGKAVTFTMRSEEVNDRFKIVVYLPRDYDKNSEKSYPVIYQLDGNIHGRFTANLMARFSCNGSVSTEAIVVGIGYFFNGWGNNKVRDYTYPPPKSRSGFWGREGAGGGLKFHTFLKDRLIPYIDSLFRTDNTRYGRTLMGHAIGGYFVLFTMLSEYQIELTGSAPFKNFIAVSPSIFYAREYLFDLEARLVAFKVPSLPVNLYMSMSDIEEKTPIKYFPFLCRRLNRRGHKGFVFKAESLKKLRHLETVKPGYSNGLKFVFNRRR